MDKPKKMQTAIVCRTNAPLVKCAFDLIKRRVMVKIVGRDIGSLLKVTIGDVLGAHRNAPIPDFLLLLDRWINDIRTKYKGREDKQQYVTDCEDQNSVIRVMADHAKDARGIFDVIDRYFVDEDEVGEDPDTVVLVSGHRAKGLEWGRVVVLRPDLMPHPNAQREADLRQEEHIKYVALTRPMEQLWILGEKEPADGSDRDRR